MCNLLRDHAGKPVICNCLKTSRKSNTIHPIIMLIMLLGRGLKVCSARSHNAQSSVHSYTDCLHVRDLISPMPSYVDTAKAEIFTKTLALFCALWEHGCSSAGTTEYADQNSKGICGDNLESESDEESDTVDEASHTSHPPGASVLVQHLHQSLRPHSDENRKCKGTLLLHRDWFHQHYIS